MITLPSSKFPWVVAITKQRSESKPFSPLKRKKTFGVALWGK